jgi:pimeloyl-ACP methyl ester carboxylesterase
VPSVRRGDATLYYEVTGTGSPVCFVHGMGGNRLSWFQQVPVFAERHTVVTLDQRGFGRSTCPGEAFHPRHFAGDLFAVLDAAGVSRSAVVCQSLGGWMGLRAALENPERVACLVLSATPAGLFTPGIAAAAARVAAGLQREGVRGNLALAPDFPARRPALAFLYDQISGLNTGFDPAWSARLADDEGRIDPERLAGWRVPTLLLAGDRDQLFPPQALEEVARAIPGCEFQRFEGVGHSIYFEAPERFNAALAEFLTRHGSE